ncbi:MAG: hypothetical protein WCE36_25340, partial [Pseudolabrys sp.]
ISDRPYSQKFTKLNCAIGHRQSYFAGKLEPAHAKRQAMVIQLISVYSLRIVLHGDLQIGQIR